jgi:alpha-beta hydrolase superfamily lysophospholipase
VLQDGEEIMLMTYRYPVDPSVRKGVIFHIHGFGSYCERYAFIAKMWAEAGYEVIALD